MFINCLRCDVGRGPVVELFPVETNTALADRELADIGADGFVELGAAHAQVDGRSTSTDEAGKDVFAPGPGGRLRQFCRHKCSMPRVAAEGGLGLSRFAGLCCCKTIPAYVHLQPISFEASTVAGVNLWCQVRKVFFQLSEVVEVFTIATPFRLGGGPSADSRNDMMFRPG
jgi:hypothetical protein